MRTTLTLDEDVAKLLDRLRAERRTSLKAIVNEVLRAGLTAVMAKPRRPRAAYATRPVSLGRPRLPDLDDVAGVLALIEGDDHR
jgi:hypothetical protein